MGRLAGKIALVTGAGNGIGRGCAERFAAEGALVLAVDREAAALAGLPDGCRPFACDLLDEAAVAELATSVGREFGRLDALVTAAAFAHFAWIEELSLADWRATLQGELDTVFLTARALWPWLKASGRAAIVNFGSANAWNALEGSPALAHCAGKGGVTAMTRQLAMEGGPHGIRANSIAPGLIVTAATRAHMTADPAFCERALAGTMVKRLGEPADIAACAVWLVSDEAGYVTGADIRVDGGATAW